MGAVMVDAAPADAAGGRKDEGVAIIATAEELRAFEDQPCKHCGRRLGKERAFGILYPEPIGLVGFVHQTVCLSAYESMRNRPAPMLVEVA